MNVFISRPNWSDPEFELGLENFLKFVVGLDLIPRTLGVTDYPTRSPLDEVIDILDECKGAIILGYPHIKVKSGYIKDDKRSRSFILPTEWNHLEAGLAYAKGLPILVIHHTGISTGVFDRGVMNVFVHDIDLSKSDWYLNKNVHNAILAWKEKCKQGKSNRNISIKQEEVFGDVTVARIKRVLALLEIGADELALEIGEKNQEYLLRILNGASPDFSFLMRISDRFNVDETWLKTGKGSPLKRIDERRFDLQQTEKILKKSYKDLEFFFFMANETEEKLIGCAIKEDEHKYIVYDHYCHLSSHVGGGGRADIYNFYKFIEQLYTKEEKARFNSVYVTKDEFWDLINGDMSYKMIDKTFRHYYSWALDFIDIKFKIFTREEHARNFGEEYAKALEIARDIEFDRSERLQK